MVGQQPLVAEIAPVATSVAGVACGTIHRDGFGHGCRFSSRIRRWCRCILSKRGGCDHQCQSTEKEVQNARRAQSSSLENASLHCLLLSVGPESQRIPFLSDKSVLLVEMESLADQGSALLARMGTCVAASSQAQWGMKMWLRND